MIDRSSYYKEPLKLGAQTIYLSGMLAKVDEQHWKQFEIAVTSGEGFKVGDFIDLSVQLTAQQLIKFMDEFKKMETIGEVHKMTDDVILELAREIKLEVRKENKTNPNTDIDGEV